MLLAIHQFLWNVCQYGGYNRFEGNRMASSFVNGDAGTGVLKSPLFRIERRYVKFSDRSGVLIISGSM